MFILSVVLPVHFGQTIGVNNDCAESNHRYERRRRLATTRGGGSGFSCREKVERGDSGE